MDTILGRIKQKAQQVIQGVGNFIDRDKTMQGVQLAPGGLGNRIQQNLNPSIYVNNLRQSAPSYLREVRETIPFTPNNQERFNQTIAGIAGNNTAGRVAGQAFNNWLAAPLLQVPYHLRETVAGEDKSLLNRGMHGVSAVGGLLPGVDDALFAGYNTLKAKAAGNSATEALAGNEYTGLGDAITGGREGTFTDILNMAELPLILLAGGVKAKNAKGALESSARLMDKAKQAENLFPTVKNLPDKLFRAVDSTNDKAVLGTGRYFAETVDTAKKFGKQIEEFEVPKGTKLIDLSNQDDYFRFGQEAIRTAGERFGELSRRIGQEKALAEVMRDYARKLGFNGIKGEGTTEGIVLFDDVIDGIKRSQDTKNVVRIDDVLSSRNAQEVAQNLDFLPKLADELTGEIDELTKIIRNHKVISQVDETIPPKKQLQEILSQKKSELREVNKQINEITSQKAPTNQATMIADEAGNIIPLKQPVGSTTQLDDILNQSQTVLDANRRITQVPDEVLALPGGNQTGLPRPNQGNVTLTQLKKLVNQGDGLEGVRFVAKNADEARQARRLGLGADQIELAPNTLKQGKSLQFPQDEAALYETPKQGVQGVPKGGLKRLWDDLVRSSKGVIERSGEDGKRISKILETIDEEGALTGGIQADEMVTALRGLSKQEKATLADVIEGNARPLSQAQENAVRVWKGIASDIRNRAIEVGLDIGLIEDYFPHHVLEGDKNKINSMLRRTSQRRYGNLELSRQTDLPYDKDPSVLLDYIYAANNRIAEAKHAGPGDEILYNLANRIGEQGGDSAQVTKYLDQILGKNQDPTYQSISRTIRDVQTVRKLNPMTAVKNLTQNISTLLRTDTGSTAKAIKNIITNPQQAISNARKAGEIDANVARTLEDYAGSGNVATSWIRAIGMLGAEKVNRIIAVNAGMEYTAKLINQAKRGSASALRELKRLGFNSLDELDDTSVLKGGRRISKETQFTTSAGELPYGWHTPVGKIMTQFKSFAYKHSKYLNSEFNPISGRIWSEMKQGNVKPFTNALIAYGVAAPVVGEIVNDINALFYNRKREDTDTLAERYISNILAATSFGLLDSTGGLFGQYGAGGVVSTIFGPTAGDVVDIGETISGLKPGAQDYERNQAYRNILNQVPFGVGRLISNTVVPNSYIDNLYGGVNEGLNKTDKQTYKTLKEQSPEQAELFKERKQAQRDNGLLDRILGSGRREVTTPSRGATETEQREFRRQVYSMLSEGVVPGEDVLKAHLFNEKTATSKSLEERMDVYKTLNSVLENEAYTDEQKRAVIKASGADPRLASYYNLASKDQEVRLQEIMPQLDNLSDEDKLSYLMSGRRVVGGKQLVSNAMVDYLYEMDYLTDNQRKAIKALKYDEINDKFYYSKSYRGGSSRTSRVSFSQAEKLYKMSLPKFSKLKSLDFLLSLDTSGQTKRPADTLLSSILNAPIRRNTNNNLWF